VLFIDAEQGSVDSYLEEYAKEGYDLRNIYLIYSQSITEVRSILAKVRKNEDIHLYDENGNETEEIYLDADGLPFRADAVVVDGATLLFVARQQGLTEFSKLRATVRARQREMVGLEKTVSIQGAGIEIKDYNTLKFDGQGLILDLLATGKHFAITAREVDEKVSVKGGAGEFQSVPTGKVIPEGFKDIGYNAKTVLRTYKDEKDGEIYMVVEDKDRSLIHKQNEVLKNPSLMDWAIVTKKNVGKQQLVNSKVMEDAVSKEVKSSEEKDMLYDKAIVYSEIAELETAEEFRKYVQKKLFEMTSEQKAETKENVTKSGLPTNLKDIEDVEVFKKILKVIFP